MHSRPARLDKKLARELKALSTAEDPYDTIIGKTMCTYDFYEGEWPYFQNDGTSCLKEDIYFHEPIWSRRPGTTRRRLLRLHG